VQRDAAGGSGGCCSNRLSECTKGWARSQTSSCRSLIVASACSCC
jgi:hypothetical protein